MEPGTRITERRSRGRLLIFAAGLVLALGLVLASRPANAQVPGRLGFPRTSCGEYATVTFPWASLREGGIVQWLDLSIYDNGFAQGTFLGAGPLDPATSELRWEGILPRYPHFWRVNTLTEAGWVTTDTGAFVPCAGPDIRGVSYGCRADGSASIIFYWSPSSPPGSQSWLDLSLFDNGFAPGTFVAIGPLHISIVAISQSLAWHGILANRVHYWRFNTLFPGGWTASRSGSFVAVC